MQWKLNVSWKCNVTLLCGNRKKLADKEISNVIINQTKHYSFDTLSASSSEKNSLSALWNVMLSYTCNRKTKLVYILQVQVLSSFCIVVVSNALNINIACILINYKQYRFDYIFEFTKKNSFKTIKIHLLLNIGLLQNYIMNQTFGLYFHKNSNTRT